MSVTAFIQPREAPRPDVPEPTLKTLPIISTAATGLTGVGGVTVQGQLFPPTRPEAAAAPKSERPQAADVRPTLKQKRGLFDLKGGPATNLKVMKVTISHPILEENGDQNPLNKIATIDLATAARNEKERRANDLQRASALIATRPAPNPPWMAPAPADGPQQAAASVKRKEVAQSVASHLTLPNSVMELIPDGTALTTSAQLSPGAEEMRRRSPRQVPVDSPVRRAPSPLRQASPPSPPLSRAASPEQQQQSPELPAPRKPEPAVRAAPPASRAAPPTRQEFQTTAPRHAPIRPSRQLPVSPKEAPPAPVKTALQRRPTTGLPGNPRSMTVKTGAKETQAPPETQPEAPKQRQQTIMFVNNIVYDDPHTVERIISGVDAHQQSTEEKGVPDNLVMHRPRPIPRKMEVPEPSPSVTSHRRSQSGGSVVTRKSIVMQRTPGSPTQLPPLPPPPANANVQRPLPNNTKSMTIDEKMTLLFPTPPSGGRDGQPGSPNVPQLPPLPLHLMSLGGESPIADFSDFQQVSRMSKSTNRTTKTSIKTDNIFEVDELPQTLVSNAQRRTQENSLADEVGSSWLPGTNSEADTRSRPSMSTAAKRASSPLLPPVRASAMTESTDSRTHDDSTVNWGSVHSPAAAVDVQAIRQLPRTTYIRPEQGASRNEPRQTTVPFVLEDEDAAGDSWFHDDEGPTTAQRLAQGRWHRRVGDECPTFSGRKAMVRARKMPPPAPLILGPPSTKNPKIVKAAVLSPLEPPEQALAYIKSQLKKFEQPGAAVLQSPDQRLRLLDNLEKEMDQQAGHWQDMHHDLSRDSISTFKTSPDVESRRESMLSTLNRDLSRQNSQKSIAADRRAVKRSRMRSGSTFKSVEDTASTLSSTESSNASVWQKRLAEAQTDYVENTSRLQTRRNMNYVSIAQLGSPTPPESDESDAEPQPEPRRPQNIDTVTAQASRRAVRKSLWSPQTGDMWTPPTSMLWTPAPATTTSGAPSDTELPGLGVRPASRVPSEPLRIQSGRLWQSRESSDKSGSRVANGLWGTSVARSVSAAEQPEQLLDEDDEDDFRQQERRHSQQMGQSQKAPRPNTARPPRRGKRVTLLPDILESPEPLPDKRGTLGIFQFPWGERSDTATVQPRNTMFMAMPGTMTSGGQTVNAALAARSKQLEASEYSSSFFDDYDDDDDDEGSSDEEGSDEDDGFDETTLWEIASLLKTELVPSRNSLLPPAESVAAESDALVEMPSEDEGEDNTLRGEIVVGIDESESALPNFPSPPTQPRKPDFSSLWEPKKAAADKTQGSHGVGLPHPDDRTWEQYNETGDTARAKPRLSQPAAIESSKLWGAVQKEESAQWAAKKAAPHRETRQEASKMEAPAKQQAVSGLKRSNSKEKAKKANKTRLWAPPTTPVATKVHKGMFAIGPPKQPDNRTSTEAPAAVDMVRKARSLEHMTLEPLSSTTLWTPPAQGGAVPKQGWMVESSAPKPATTAVVAKVDPFEALKAAKASRPSLEREPFQYPDLFATLEEDEISDTASVDDNAGKQTSWWNKMKSSFGVADSAPTKPKPVPLRRQHRPNVAVQGNWDAELREALASSYPHIPRPVATPEMWEAALREAVARSKPYDPHTTHPVFVASSLVTKSETFHPAATGYTFDVACVHPVFFGSQTSSWPEDQLHPAWCDTRRSRRQRSMRDRAVSRERSLSRADSRRRNKEGAQPAMPAMPTIAPSRGVTLITGPVSSGVTFIGGPAAAPTPAPVSAAPAPAPSVTEDEQALLAKRDLILAQIEALEREKEFAEAAVRQGSPSSFRQDPGSSSSSSSRSGYAASHESRATKGALWSKPADINTASAAARPTTPGDGIMWTPGPKTPKSGRPTILHGRTDSETEAIRNRARKEGGRRGDGSAAAAGTPGSGREPLWNRQEGEQLRRNNSTGRGQGKDWLDEASKRKSSRVMLRY